MNSVNSVFENFDILSHNIKTDVLLYGDPRLDGQSNKIILEATMSHIKTSFFELDNHLLNPLFR